MKLDEAGLPVAKADVPVEEPATCSCPRLEKEDWDGVENDWSDITFVKTMTSAVLGVPVGYDSVRAELEQKAQKLGGKVPEDAMQLREEGSTECAGSGRAADKESRWSTPAYRASARTAQVSPRPP